MLSWLQTWWSMSPLIIRVHYWWIHSALFSSNIIRQPLLKHLHLGTRTLHCSSCVTKITHRSPTACFDKISRLALFDTAPKHRMVVSLFPLNAALDTWSLVSSWRRLQGSLWRVIFIKRFGNKVVIKLSILNASGTSQSCQRKRPGAWTGINPVRCLLAAPQLDFLWMEAFPHWGKVCLRKSQGVTWQKRHQENVSLKKFQERRWARNYSR